MQHRIHEFLTEAAAAKGDALALIDYKDQSYSWSDLVRLTEAAETVLRNRGVCPGDRIVLAFENAVSVTAFIFAASRLDAILVVINARLTEAEMNRIFAHSDPKLVVFSTDVSKPAAAHAAHYGAETIRDAFGEVAILKRDAGPADPTFEDAAEQVALMLYTSGTTGAPKAAMLTHSNLIHATIGTQLVRGVQSDDRVFLALPLSHIFGFVTLLVNCYATASMRLEAKFDVKRLYGALHQDVTMFPGVPQMHAHLFHYAETQGHKTYAGKTLRYVSSGGAPLDPAWKAQAEAFYRLPLQNGYGLTEGAAGVCATRVKIGDPDISCGLPMKDCEFRLDFKVAGAEPDEGIGEILLGGPQVMKGYFRDPEQTQKVLTEDGFFRTGDLGRFDDQGRLHIVGRCKELIIRSGFNVYPVEIEATLTEHPEVIVAGVVGRTVSGNEEVLAFVKVDAASTVTEADLASFVHDRLAPYKRPSRIIVADHLPAAPTGKILKAKLIESFAQELAVDPDN